MANLKLLLVDDEVEFVNTLAERLRMRGYKPGIAFSGEQALQIVRENVPDVIVLDLRMPGIDGMEVLRRVKSFCPQVQVIILTGHGSKQDSETASQLGAFEHLNKPVDINELVETIDEAYRRVAGV